MSRLERLIQTTPTTHSNDSYDSHDSIKRLPVPSNFRTTRPSKLHRPVPSKLHHPSYTVQVTLISSYLAYTSSYLALKGSHWLICLLSLTRSTLIAVEWLARIYRAMSRNWIMWIWMFMMILWVSYLSQTLVAHMLLFYSHYTFSDAVLFYV
jgi:hypothetical protein